jgi:Holliday junction resolvase RusA-like endonuclease
LPSITVYCKIVGWQRSGVDWARRRIYEQDRTRDLKARIAAAWREQHPDEFFPKGVPVRVDIEAFRPLPKSRPKRIQWEPDVCKPDKDNLEKLVLDALNGVAYADDAQVVTGNTTKRPRRRGVVEGIWIKVEAVHYELYA